MNFDELTMVNPEQGFKKTSPNWEIGYNAKGGLRITHGNTGIWSGFWSMCVLHRGGTEHMDTESDVLTWVANDSHDSNTATSLVMCICSCRSCCAVSVSVWINSSGSPLRARDPTHGNVTHVTSTTHLVPPGGLMTKF